MPESDRWLRACERWRVFELAADYEIQALLTGT